MALKNSNREIIDKLGWGSSQDFESAPVLNPEEGQSIARKGHDTDDNSQDFEVCETPTPTPSGN
ncbi:MAG: hypothetical protein A2205_02440 [Candidatus Staskawiczbacteria bacterium RIFOXYA1_FULL_37_15]|nr:MAG: hypothetical protein A2205_02440 [Candidatus Staskawiczbacteria bacterium RIFOXYA1_FULL_37_15]